jgi:hypothetical protein
MSDDAGCPLAMAPAQLALVWGVLIFVLRAANNANAATHPASGKRLAASPSRKVNGS